LSKESGSLFRPCIDLHKGRVKQIVGASLTDGGAPLTNFETDLSPAHYAEMYRRDGLAGGHVIMLGPGNEAAAREALAAWPGGMQLGGGVNAENAVEWLDAGASHVIVTSWVFRDGMVAWDRLKDLESRVGAQRLVLDLSCRTRDGRHFIVTDRWQKFTEVELNPENLARLAQYCDEFLVHAADVEGKRAGIDEDVLRVLAEGSPIAATYAGGVRDMADVEKVRELGGGRVRFTIGSALDIFGGNLPYSELVRYCRGRANSA
jgi:phosphoribosylformimino-5-aminoimidazole carboxamide ribotide isomerase